VERRPRRRSTERPAAREFDFVEIRRTWYFDVAIRLY
jgi:hypothetical protein